VACCWMIRLGLCGRVDEEAEGLNGLDMGLNLNGMNGGVKPNPKPTRPKDTLSFVQAVIALVRRRRSMKAVETYEQVQFLVDYVDYLRQSSKQPPNVSFDSALDLHF